MNTPAGRAGHAIQVSLSILFAMLAMAGLCASTTVAIHVWVIKRETSAIGIAMLAIAPATVVVLALLLKRSPRPAQWSALWTLMVLAVPILLAFGLWSVIALSAQHATMLEQLKVFIIFGAPIISAALLVAISIATLAGTRHWFWWALVATSATWPTLSYVATRVGLP
jgi:hypothetical protein